MKYQNEIALKKLEKVCSASADIPDQIFADLIYTALTDWNISEQSFRDTFALSGETVQRWTTQKNLPQPDIRPVILQWVKEQTSNSAN
ncbi:MAG: hypothetical protein KUG81_06475 [Gammaproteobacteria bacterium]|nr:hypothetical protein [Gammaproteobacteria bacterium]